MKRFGLVLICCILNAVLVTGEELYLLTDSYEIYRYNTNTRQAKQLAGKVNYMACDYERNLIYYVPTSNSNQAFTKIFRMNSDGGDAQTITDKADSINAISIDQETGNLYYYSPEGIGFYSYQHDYRKTVISNTSLGENVYEIGFHGNGANKRVYWSTSNGLYRFQTHTSQLKDSEVYCQAFSILDNGMVCTSNFIELYLANLDGVKTDSLTNLAITSSILDDIYCAGSIQDIITVDRNMYILCRFPYQVLKMGLINITLENLIPKIPEALRKDSWFSLCLLPLQTAVLPSDSVLPSVFSIWVVLGAVVIGIVLVVVPAVVIPNYKKKASSRQSNNHPSEEPEVAPYASVHDSTPQEDHVYTLHSTGYVDLTAESSPVYEVIS